MTWREFLTNYPAAAVFASELGEDPEAFAAQDPFLAFSSVVRAIVGSGFSSDGQRVSEEYFLNGGREAGDCGTLSESCAAILNALGIEARVGCKREPFLVTDVNMTVLGRPHSNVDNGMWFFGEHYWIEACGMRIDLLFGGISVDESTWVEMDHFKCDESGRKCFVFPNGVLYQSNSELMNKQVALTTDPEKAEIYRYLIQARKAQNPAREQKQGDCSII
ncbi:hypothetical protein AB0N09_42315 [Streptomyces erythrochromogenes]|uniref:hypothetical protein n=1 Tax=Streptomyces erythrochromogenes TaxID=285574 RepID=UPI0034278376